jgi:hypothetical protein
MALTRKRRSHTICALRLRVTNLNQETMIAASNEGGDV